MVTLLELFLEFFKIGLFMFGGGYGGIALMFKELVEIKQWVSEERFMYMLGIAESTPGPIAINSATWIGYMLGGLPGSIIATMGVVLPAYLVMLAVVVMFQPYMDQWYVKILFRGINAAVAALILYAFIKVANTALMPKNAPTPDLVAVAIFAISFALLYFAKQHPIVVIAVAAGSSIVARILLNL